jgi:succinate dehydrogenase / fumarate reductase membrane anchor subunit
MSIRTPLGRVLGTGSAKEGVHHWWVQRVSAVALIPLTLWFIVSMAALPLADHGAVTAWLSQGWTAVLLILFVGVSAWHSKLGVQVVIEDYVHGHGAKALALILSSFVHVVAATASIFAILKVAFRSMA